ncbi:hypothetical protein PF004_g5524 [Phytophthora fragariae]|nr:hypothetical protein PF004_g5524 [Phytophthora fragariae]
MGYLDRVDLASGAASANPDALSGGSGTEATPCAASVDAAPASTCEASYEASGAASANPGALSGEDNDCMTSMY